MTEQASADSSGGPRWRPISSVERRVLGVLVEKAKTTPEAYPLSLNALRTGCNQKNNRAPLMQLEDDQVEEAIESLRALGAVAVVQGTGRVDKFRHLAYEWLGVDKVQMAVMAELLLRGAQTVGELRGRAARMEPIKDLAELRPVLDALVAKGLVMYLTPPGRGAVVTHTLYLEPEREKVLREAATVAPADAPEDRRPPSTSTAVAMHPADAESEASGWKTAVAELREEIADVKRELADARSQFEATTRQLRDALDDLNRQLGNDAPPQPR